MATLGCSTKSGTQPGISANERTCRELERDLVFNTTAEPGINEASATQNARSLRLYEEHNCKAFEEGVNPN